MGIYEIKVKFKHKSKRKFRKNLINKKLLVH